MNTAQSIRREIETAEGEVVDIERLGFNAQGSFDPDVLRWQIEQIGKQKANLEAAAKLLGATKGPVLAQLTNAVRSQQRSITRKEAEDIAAGSDEYMAHIESHIEAERLFGIANAKWKAVLAYADALRTAQANNRAQMNLR